MKRFRLTSPKLPRLNENDIERQCVDLLRYRQWRPERLHAGRFKSIDGERWITGHAAGTPDYVCTHALYPAFYLEVKRPGCTPTPEQELKHAELRLDGLAVVAVNSYSALLVWLAWHTQKSRECWRAELERL